MSILTDYHAAPLWHASRHFHVRRTSDLQLVPKRDGHLAERFLDSSQRHRLDQEQAISSQMGQPLLHRHCHSGSAILDLRDHSKFVSTQHHHRYHHHHHWMSLTRHR